MKDLEIQPEQLQPLIETLHQQLRAVLKNQFVGLYIHGSVALSAFEEDRSDIDFLVVTQKILDSETLEELKEMHKTLFESNLYGAKILEGSYIPKNELWRYDPEHAIHPALRCDGTFAIDGHGIDWVIQRYVLREKGIKIAGPEIKSLITPVSSSDLMNAAYGILKDWWYPQLTDQSLLKADEYQAYAVVTMCRSFYTIQFADVVSKSDAAEWFVGAYPQWESLVRKAETWRKGMNFNLLIETLLLIQFTLETTKELLSEI
ncbi:MAG: DUF4111 domain-containing protein [Anaerolineaceae bacterium]|nr:DUF4111 domain-containing protein [Anaerolineaceae bacterium]